MPTEAAAMTTIKNALVKRLSLCRKRIMDGLGPLTLYAQADIGLHAQLSRNAIHSHYRRAEKRQGGSLNTKRAPRPSGCPLKYRRRFRREARLPHRRWLAPVVVAAYGVVGAIVDTRIAIPIGIRPAIVGATTPVERGAAGIKARGQPGGLSRAHRGDRQRSVQVEFHQRLGGNPDVGPGRSR